MAKLGYALARIESVNLKYPRETLASAVAASTSFAGVVRHLGLKQSGGTQAHIAKRCRHYDLDTEHFRRAAWNAGAVAMNRKTPFEILVRLPEGSLRAKQAQLRRALREMNIPNECVLCKLGPEWNGLPLTLEIDHIDGDWLNNLIENLRYLCPNCHSQQVTNKSWKHGSVAQRQRQSA